MIKKYSVFSVISARKSFAEFYSISTRVRRNEKSIVILQPDKKNYYHTLFYQTLDKKIRATFNYADKE